jgi:redox-sensitive bicupin YhaK (pirin superfamily)
LVIIMLRRDAERRHVQRGKYDSWLTFYPGEQPDPLDVAFRVLATFDEMRLPPGGGSAPHPRDEGEIVSYVYKGALAQENSTGSSGVITAGEFQRMTAGRGIGYKETNASRTDWTHVFRIALLPSEVGLEYSLEQKRFAVAQRRNVLCMVASLDGRNGSLPIRQDALIYSSILDPGRHLVHELLPGRSAWLHIMYGEAKLNGIVLTQGDGVGITIEPSVSLTVKENTEILLVDLGPALESGASKVVP